MSPPSTTSLPPPTPSTPPGCHRALGWAPLSYSKFPLAILHMVVYMFPCHSHNSSHPLLPTLCPKFCSLCLYLHCSSANRFSSTISCMCVCVCVCVCVLVTQLCLTLCIPVDCILPGSSVHGILQARILQQVAVPSPGDLPKPCHFFTDSPQSYDTYIIISSLNQWESGNPG